jgi:hypothetical protein
LYVEEQKDFLDSGKLSASQELERLDELAMLEELKEIPEIAEWGINFINLQSNEGGSGNAE